MSDGGNGTGDLGGDVDSIRRRLEEARRTSDDLARQVKELDSQIKRLEAEHRAGEGPDGGSPAAG